MFERILVPLDGSQRAEQVLPHAANLALAFEAQVLLLRVQTHPEDPSKRLPDPITWEIDRSEARRYLDQIACRMEAEGVQTKTLLREGKPAESIIMCVEEEQADLIVLSSIGKTEYTGWNISSTVQNVVQRANTSIMLTRTESVLAPVAKMQYRNICLPVDASLRAEYAIPVTAHLAQCFQSKVHAVHILKRIEHCGPLPPSLQDQELANELTTRNREKAQSYLHGLQKRFPSIYTTYLREASNVSTALHQLVEQKGMDLVVLTAHGSSGSRRFPYGNIALSFLLFGSIPLLVLQDLPGKAKRENHSDQLIRLPEGVATEVHWALST